MARPPSALCAGHRADLEGRRVGRDMMLSTRRCRSPSRRAGRGTSTPLAGDRASGAADFPSLFEPAGRAASPPSCAGPCARSTSAAQARRRRRQRNRHLLHHGARGRLGLSATTSPSLCASARWPASHRPLHRHARRVGNQVRRIRSVRPCRPERMKVVTARSAWKFVVWAHRM